MNKEVVVIFIYGNITQPYKGMNVSQLSWSWMNLESVIQRNGHKEKNEHHILMHVYGIRKQ